MSEQVSIGQLMVTSVVVGVICALAGVMASRRSADQHV